MMEKHRRFRPLANPLTACLAVGGALLLSGCGTIGDASRAPAPAGAAAPAVAVGPAVAFASTAPEGAETVVDDAAVGGRVRIVAGRAYSAASGRVCRRFNTEDLGGDRTVRSWAVCRRDGGDGWQLVTVGAAELSYGPLQPVEETASS